MTLNLESYLTQNITVSDGFAPALRSQLQMPNNIFETETPVGREQCIDTLDRFEVGDIPPVGLLQGLSHSLFANFAETVKKDHGDEWQNHFRRDIQTRQPLSPNHPVLPPELQNLAQPHTWVDRAGQRLVMGRCLRSSDRSTAVLFLNAIGDPKRLNLGTLGTNVFNDPSIAYFYDLLWLLSANFLLRGNKAMGIHLTTFDPQNKTYGSGPHDLTPITGVGELRRKQKKPLEISFLRRPDIFLHRMKDIHPYIIALHEVFHIISLGILDPEAQAMFNQLEQLFLQMADKIKNPFTDYALACLYDSPMTDAHKRFTTPTEVIESFLADLIFFLKDFEVSLPTQHSTEECQIYFSEFKLHLGKALKETFKKTQFANRAEQGYNQVNATHMRFQRFYSAHSHSERVR